jgi:hypothetical protein
MLSAVQAVQAAAGRLDQAQKQVARQHLDKATMVEAQPVAQLNIRVVVEVEQEPLVGMLQILLQVMVEMAQLLVIAVHQ